MASWLFDNWQFVAALLALVVRGEVFIRRTNELLQQFSRRLDKLEEDVEKHMSRIETAIAGDWANGGANRGLSGRLQVIETLCPHCPDRQKTKT